MPVEFVVDGVVRKGGSATVRKILVDGSVVALKSFHPDVEKEAFVREMNVMKGLKHNHLVKLFASIEADGNFHLLLQPWCEV